MANYHDQARAIWSALDTMLEQDPEAYRKFVTEQLQQGREMLKKQNTQEDASGPTNSQNLSTPLEQAFQKMSLGIGGQVDGKKVEVSSNGKQAKMEDGVEKSGSDTNLLDDEIGGNKSILEQIVKKPDCSLDEEDIKLETLQFDVPAATNSAPAKKKPLIEEV